MSLIKDLSKVKDSEITLEDVKRAEEIIARANKLLGRATITEHHYWRGWGTLTVPYQPYWYTTTQGGSNNVLCATGTTSDSLNAVNLSNVSLTDAVAKILS